MSCFNLKQLCFGPVHSPAVCYLGFLLITYFCFSISQSVLTFLWNSCLVQLEYISKHFAMPPFYGSEYVNILMYTFKKFLFWFHTYGKLGMLQNYKVFFKFSFSSTQCWCWMPILFLFKSLSHKKKNLWNFPLSLALKFWVNFICKYSIFHPFCFVFNRSFQSKALGFFLAQNFSDYFDYYFLSTFFPVLPAISLFIILINFYFLFPQLFQVYVL